MNIDFISFIVPWLLDEKHFTSLSVQFIEVDFFIYEQLRIIYKTPNIFHVFYNHWKC